MTLVRITEILSDLRLPACSWGLCRCNWFRSWCLLFGCNAGSTGSRSPASSTWQSSSCLHSPPLYSTHTALPGHTQKDNTGLVSSTQSRATNGFHMSGHVQIQKNNNRENAFCKGEKKPKHNKHLKVLGTWKMLNS